MTTTLLIFNGLHFPIDAVDASVAHAQATSKALTALFIVSRKKDEDGYAFPNDLELTEEPKADEVSENEDMAIIASTIRLLRRQASFAQITLQTRILPDPHKEDLQEFMEEAGQIFIADNTLDPSLLAITRDRLVSFLEGLVVKTTWIN